MPYTSRSLCTINIVVGWYHNNNYYFRPHSMHSVRIRCGLLLQDGVAWSVCLFVTLVSPAKQVEPIEMPFGCLMRVGPRNHALYMGSSSPREGAILGVVGPMQIIGSQCSGALRCNKINNVDSGTAAAMLPTGRCHITYCPSP